MYNVVSKLMEIKEGLYDFPVNHIPVLVGDVFKEYEDYVFSKDSTEEERNSLMKIEYFRDDLESDNNLSIRDIEDKLSNLITQMEGVITGDAALDNDIIKSITDLFKINKYHIKLNLIPHLLKNFKLIVEDEQLIKILYKLEIMGYEIGFITNNEEGYYERLSFDKSVIEIDKKVILNIIYDGDLIIYNLD